jgi:thiamine biosynthesis lipoprotein
MQSAFSDYYDSSSMFHGFLGDIMGTRFDIVIIGKGKSETGKVWEKTVHELRRLERMLNRFDEESEVSRINLVASEHPVEVSEEMWAILMDCRYYHDATQGLFDITLKDFSKIVFNENHRSVYFSHKDMHLDFGGYAKGYALDKIKNILLEADITQCFVDFGGSSILALGHHPYGDIWKVSLKNPFAEGETVDEIALRDESMSTSGNTPLYTKHIIDPFSGEYNDKRKLVNVVSPHPIDAEVLSTALMVADTDKKKSITDQFDKAKVNEYNL